MAGLTFVNQVGAVEGMNQAAPGTLIPESFVRWSQDVLFDRAGLMRRRGPFNKFKMYDNSGTENIDGLFDHSVSGSPDLNDDERVIAVLSTYNPIGAERIGMLVDSFNQTTSARETILRVFDNNFKYLGYEVLPFDVPLLSIVSAKPALGGGLWVSIVDNPSDPDTHYQFFWRGGYGSDKSTSVTGDFTLETVSGVSIEHNGISTLVNTDTVANLSEGQFVYARNVSESKDYYIGTIKEIDRIGTGFTLEKRPFIWDSINVDNNHNTVLTVEDANRASTTATITTLETILFETGDVVTISGIPAPYADYNGSYTITVTSPTTFTYTIATTPSHYNPTSSPYPGVVKMDNDLTELVKTDLPLKFVSVRPYAHMHGRGLLNIVDGDLTGITSGTEGTSAEGHWQAANVLGYNLYRASDNFYIGKINTVSNNTTANLYADSGIKLQGEEYIMRSTDNTDLVNDFCVGSSTNTLYNFAGLYTAVYAGYQWYGNFAQDDANTNRVVFSASHDREAIDLSRDAADSIIFPGKSKFRGLGSSSAGLLVFLEDRTYILRGNDRTNFSIEQLVPEGCLCASSIVEYGGGVFWAGKSGIMFFDGASVRNLTKDNIGLYYTDSLDVFNPEQDRVLGFMHKNNLIMHYTSFKSPFDPIRYEPLYADDWNNSEDKYGKETWDQFDPDFEYEDFFTQNNTPIYWDRKILNNPEESASTGTGITYSAGGRVTNKALTSNVATLTISNGHGLKVGDKIVVKDVDATFNTPTTPSDTTDTVTAITTTSVSYARTATNVSSTAVSSSTAIAIKSSGATWGTTTNIQKYGPLRKNTSMTFNIYIPTNALTTLSNMDFRGSTSIETVYGLKTILGVNSVESNKFRARLIDIHPVFDTNTNGSDDLLIEKINIPTTDLVRGPDFYLQTKHFTVGDPILRKWFQRIMISMLLYDGAIRMDLVDDDDNDEVDINKKKHKNWEVFVEKGYDWDYLGKGDLNDFGIVFPKITSPLISSWENVENALYLWDELFTADFNRYSKRIAWRKSSVGFRLYQLNNYKKPFNGVVTTPTRVEMQGFSIGFKPIRSGRV